ncbi:DUF2945 domain-containing protein [Tropicimonas sp. S265A]|uniref:DUF2945 domain-containing protein n=1 Tax=Tropicimonas sp. S265A TaxID=3415134 RepID=UPI003C79D389
MGFSVGDSVKWNWGDGEGSGEIAERFTNDVSRMIEGTEVTRNASSSSPAFLIKQSDGSNVLKSCTELKAA